MNKPKGMLQILWERGFMNPAMQEEDIVRYYLVNEKKNNDGTIIDGTGLREATSILLDFEQETTLSQFRAENLCVEVGCSPKYHLKIAGGGIGFCLRITKNSYQGKRISEKNEGKLFEIGCRTLVIKL